MSTQTDAISNAIGATTPDGLVWLPNPGHEPSIPDGWELARVRICNGENYSFDLGEWFWHHSLGDVAISHYAIRRKPTQPTLTELTPFDEDPAELRKRMVLEALSKVHGRWYHAAYLAEGCGEPFNLIQETLNQLVSEGAVEGMHDNPMLYRIAQQPTSTRSAAMVISGTLTSIGTTFAAIQSGERVITLSLTTEQTRWLGQYVGGEVKLTVEVQP